MIGIHPLIMTGDNKYTTINVAINSEMFCNKNNYLVSVVHKD